MPSLLVTWCVLYVLLISVRGTCWILSCLLPGGTDAFKFYFGTESQFSRYSPLILLNWGRRLLLWLYRAARSFIELCWARPDQ